MYIILKVVLAGVGLGLRPGDYYSYGFGNHYPQGNVHHTTNISGDDSLELNRFHSKLPIVPNV